MPDPNEAREALIEKRRELEARVEAAQRDLSGSSDPDADPDAAAAGEALPGDAEVDELLREALSELEEIEKKLRGMGVK